MLVLTRKSGEGIRIGENIRLVVTEINDTSVRIGIEAPADLPIYRDEIYLKIREENIRAARITNLAVEKMAEMWKKGRT